MTYVVILLWVCAIAAPVLALVLIHELNTPVDPDVAALARRDAAMNALQRINARHTIPVPASRRDYGTSTLNPSRMEPHDAGTAPTLRAAATPEPVTQALRARCDVSASPSIRDTGDADRFEHSNR